MLFWAGKKQVSFFVAIFIVLQGYAQETAFLRKAREAFSQDHFDVTILESTQHLLKYPNNTEALLLRGQAYHESKQYREALVDYTHAIEIDEHLASAYALKAFTLYTLNDYKLARKNYLFAILEDKKNPLYLFNLGCIYSKEHKWKLAIENYTEALLYQPGYYDAFVNRAEAYDILKQFKLALSDYDSALRLQPHNPDLFLLRGLNLISLNRSKEAIDMFNRSLKYKPNNPNGYFSRGRALFDLKQFEKAVANFDTAITLDSNLSIAKAIREGFLAPPNEYKELEFKEATCREFKKAVDLGYGGAWEYLKKHCD